MNKVRPRGGLDLLGKRVESGKLKVESSEGIDRENQPFDKAQGEKSGKGECRE